MNASLRPWLAALLAVCLVAMAAWGAEHFVWQQARQERENILLNRLSTFRAKLEGEINSNLLLIRGLVAQISIEPDIDQQRFGLIAHELMRDNPAVRNIAAAKDLVISLIYPLEDNKAALGLNYRKHPAQWQAVSKVIETGKMIIAGPLPLVQGGSGLIARAPVYATHGDSSERFLWGLVSSVLDLDAFYRQTGLNDPDLDLEIAIRGKDASGHAGAVFFGRAALFDEATVGMDVRLPYGSWRMVAIAKESQSVTSTNSWIIRWGALIAALLASYAAFQRSSRHIEQSKVRAAIANSEKKFRGIFENARDGIFIIDPRTRCLIDMNTAATRYLGYARKELIGMLIDDLHPAEALKRLDKNLAALLRRGALVYQTTHRHKNTQLIPVEVNACLVESDAQPMVIAVTRDISMRLRAETQLRRLTNHLKTLYDASPDMLLLYTVDGDMVEINDNACRIFGYTHAAALAKTPEDLFTDASRLREAQNRLLETPSGVEPELELTARKHNGDTFFVNVRLRKLKTDGSGPTTRLLAVLRDITRAKQKEADLLRSEQRLTDAIESISEGFALWDHQDRLERCNSRYRQLVSGTGSVLRIGTRFEHIIRASLRGGRLRVPLPLEDWVQLRVREHQQRGGTHEIQTRDGCWLRLSEQPTTDGGIVSIYTDITEIRRAEDDIRYRAFFDNLTGLPNRASFVETLEAAIADAAREKSHVALMFIDLDRFKNVNDALGHEMGDRLLQEAAQRIRGCVRKTDSVARLGGDEFTVLLKHLHENMQATRVAEAFIRQLSRPYSLQNHEVYAGASIGITLCPSDGDNIQTLLKNADLAMYQAKEQGRNTFRYFTAEMTEQAQRFVALEKDLRRALEQNQFIVHFQPLLRAFDNRLVGAEALVRWQHPEKGMISPAHFIPVAEETHLIVSLGEWVLREACHQAVQWRGRAGSERPYLSVNVSSRQFLGGFGAQVVTKILAETGFPPHRLVFEITESLLMEDDEHVRKTLLELRHMGIGLAVDDFGTGFSSLSYLRRFPVNSLKIDYSFVRDMEEDPNDAQLVESIIVMAQKLNLKVVAEGVETAGQANMLRSLGCDLLQGFLFSRPVPVEQLNQLLAADRE